MSNSEYISICHIEITDINAMPRVWREAEGALKAGFDVTVIGQGEDCIYHGIKYIGFPPVHNRFSRFFGRSRRMVKRAVETGASIIQIHSPELLLYVPYLKKKKKVVVFDSHEFYGFQIEIKEYIPRFIRKLAAKFYKAYEKRVCNKVDCVLYPCTLEGKNYFEGRAKRSLKIENYSSKISIPEHANTAYKYVIHAGSLTHDRGITYLAKAVSLTEHKLILCGAFSSEEYKQRILSKSDNIEYMGLLDRDALYLQYARSSIGIATLLPVGQYTKIDNMSTKIYEYMQCGIPVILSNFPFWSKMNNKYNFGITVDPENAQEIAAAINYIIENPEIGKLYGENGRNAVKDVFNWEKEEKKLLSLYVDLLSISHKNSDN